MQGIRNAGPVLVVVPPELAAPPPLVVVPLELVPAVLVPVLVLVLAGVPPSSEPLQAAKTAAKASVETR